MFADRAVDVLRTNVVAEHARAERVVALALQVRAVARTASRLGRTRIASRIASRSDHDARRGRRRHAPRRRLALQAELRVAALRCLARREPCRRRLRRLALRARVVTRPNATRFSRCTSMLCFSSLLFDSAMAIFNLEVLFITK